jgi:galactose mutarotase-like enzyme
VVDAGPREVTLELGSDEATRTQFPWEFRARLRYALSGARLTVATTVVNPGVEELPFALGFHPYFHLPSSAKAGARIPTSATRAWDNVSKQAVDVRGPIDLTQPEVDLHLLDHGERRAVLDRGADRVVVEADAAFVRWVIWTLAGKDFVCLEPWTSPADALNSGDHLLTLAPGASRTLTMSIATELA